MKYLTLLMAAMVIYGCKSDKFTSEDFEGKVFTAKLVLDGSADANIVGISKVEYFFSKDGKAILRGTTGATTTDYPVKWQVKNDSLIVASFRQDGSISNKRWFISKIPSGYLINDEQNKLELSKN